MTWPSLSPGDQPDPIFSAARHNAVNELLALHGLDGNPGNQPEGLGRQNTFANIKNTTATDVPLGGVLGFDGSIFDADDNLSAFSTGDLSFNGVEPTQDDHASRIAIAVDLCPVGKIRRFAVSGWVRAKVDIQDTAHKFANIVDNDVTKLESSDSGLPMIPAQSGTGEKWAIVQLGGGSSNTVIVLAEAEIPAGTATATLVTPGTGTVKVLTRGTVAPQYEPTTRTETLHNFTENALATGATPSMPKSLVATREGDRLVIYDLKGDKGDDGAAGDTTIPFRLTANLANTALTANATALTTPSEDIVVRNGLQQGTLRTPGGWFGLANYNAGLAIGFEGECRDSGETESGTGKRICDIVWMEGPLTGLLVELGESHAPSKTEYTVTILSSWGSNSATRIPEQVSGAYKIYDPSGTEMLQNANSGDRWIAAWVHERSRYEAVAEAKGMRSYDGYSELGRHHFILDNNTLKYEEECDRPVTNIFMDGTELKFNKKYVDGGACTDHELPIVDLAVQKATEFIGLTNQTVAASDTTFDVTVVDLRQGIDPRADPVGNPSELITVKHPLGGAIDSSTPVWIEQNDDGSYSANTAGTAGTSPVEVGIAFQDIPAGSNTGTTYTPGTSDIYLISEGNFVTAENVSKTPLRADSNDLITVFVSKLENGNYAILNQVDYRSIPGFSTANAQWMVHRGDGVFELIEACDSDVVYHVEVNTAGDELVYFSHPWDSCGENEVSIVDLEDCPPSS